MADTSKYDQMLSDSYNTLDELFGKQTPKTTAEEQTATLNKQSQAAYQEQQLANQNAQNKFIQNQAATQMSALDAIRRSNASAIANGANAGLSAANQLSSILGLQEESMQAATDLANKDIESAAAYNTQLNANAVKGQELANALNTKIDETNAELAKSLATNADSIANIIAAERNAAAQERAAGVSTSTTETENPETGETTITESSLTPAERQRQDELNEANYKRLDDALARITANWSTDAYRTYFTSYYDPLKVLSDSDTDDAAIVKTGATTANSKDFDKGNMDAIIDKIRNQTAIIYNSKDQDAIDAWNKKLEKFITSIQTENNDGDGCVIEGSLITMADGTQRPVEEINKGDMLLAWDMFTGKFVPASVSISEHNKPKRCIVTKLIFSDKTQIDFTYEHGFYDVDLAKYVYLNNVNAKDYIGHRFLKQKNKKHKKVKLVEVIPYAKVIATHSPCTVRHLCFYVNNILTMPADTEIFTNVFEINKRKFIYSKKDMLDKVHNIGTFAPAYLAEYISSEVFYAFQCEFLKITMRRNLNVTKETVLKLIKRYNDYLK